MTLKLDNIFENFKNNLIFDDKHVLQSNYNPSVVEHRDEQIEQVASILAPVLRGDHVSNLFIYGKTGTGKTLSIQFVSNELLKRIKEEGGGFKLRIEYINCKLKNVSDTDYRILAELIKKLGGEVPATGLPTSQVANIFMDMLEKEKQILIIVLDEIDHAVEKISDDFLYKLLRLNTELVNSKISIIGISNDLGFLDKLNPRTRSSLSQEEIVFPPYNATQLKDILEKRAERAFKRNILGEGVIAKCAAYIARENGDARRAIDLLRVAGELAEREGIKQIIVRHLDEAKDKIERDKHIDFIKLQPKQFQAVLYAIIDLCDKKKNEPIFTGDIYNEYQELCYKVKLDVLTQRRIGDILSEFEMAGILNVHVVSKGRMGRMREIKLSLPKEIIIKAKEILKESLFY